LTIPRELCGKGEGFVSSTRVTYKLAKETTMKFPYGSCDFYDIITEGYFYMDRTDRIPLIEDAGKHLLFLRPRRFGKSLLLSMLENYYDVAKADEFGRLFGHLKIGKSPTQLHNRYLVMNWDFSAVEPQGDPRSDTEFTAQPYQRMHRTVQGEIQSHCQL